MKRVTPWAVAILCAACESSSPQQEAPKTVIGQDGQVWTRGNKAASTDYASMLDRQQNALLDKLRDQYTAQVIDEVQFTQAVDSIVYSAFPLDEEEAVDEPELDAIRGVTVIDGYEYTSTVENSFAQPRPGVPSARPSSDAPARVKPAHAKSDCCGNDARFETDVPSDYASVLLSEVGCSVGLIASNVGITAAHCVYDTETNAWLKVRHTASTWSFPTYRRHTSFLDETPQAVSCYRVTVPGCWVSATNNSSLTCDYAVLDFSTNGTSACPDTTPFGTWNGAWQRTDAQIEAAITWGLGFPGYVNDAGGNVNGPGLSFLYTRLNNTWGNLTFINGYPEFAPAPSVSGNDAHGVQIDNLLDATMGDSGRPQLDYISTGNYLIGHHIGNAASGTYNIDRRFDPAVWAFVQAYSPL